MSKSGEIDALALRFAPQPRSRPVLAHHSLPASICLEWERRHNADQYKMFSWSGWIVPCAEDCESGVVCERSSHDDAWCDWSEEGLIVDARAHPQTSRLRLARALFGEASEADRREWRFAEKIDPTGVLDAYTTMSVRLFAVVGRHLRTKRPQPLFWGVVKALRDAQSVLKTPSYSEIEASRSEVPRGILQEYLALPKRSAKRLVGGAWAACVNLDSVADFLASRRVFLAWAVRVRALKKRKGMCS
jgi:hypothetical protein